MKNVSFFVLFFFVFFHVDAQDISEKKLFEDIYLQISKDTPPNSLFIAKNLNLSIHIDKKRDSLMFVYHRFSFIGGTVFRFYLYGTSPEGISNQIILRLYKVIKIHEVNTKENNKYNVKKYNLSPNFKLELLKEGSVNTLSKKILTFEYRNNETNDFVLELKTDNGNPCYAVSVLCIYKQNNNK